MVFNREEAALRAEQSKTNEPGTCQRWTRTIFGAPSAGDRDRDLDADAVDGWLSEPPEHRHMDRNPPRGVPVAFSGGSHGFGHRAVSLGDGKIRSTDMGPGGYKPGFVGTTTIAQIERSMGVKYLGWSKTITGELIPIVVPRMRPSRGMRVDVALDRLRRAERISNEGTPRDKLLDQAIAVLKRVPFVGRRAK